MALSFTLPKLRYLTPGKTSPVINQNLLILIEWSFQEYRKTTNPQIQLCLRSTSQTNHIIHGFYFDFYHNYQPQNKKKQEQLHILVYY